MSVQYRLRCLTTIAKTHATIIASQKEHMSRRSRVHVIPLKAGSVRHVCRRDMRWAQRHHYTPMTMTLRTRRIFAVKNDFLNYITRLHYRIKNVALIIFTFDFDVKDDIIFLSC